MSSSDTQGDGSNGGKEEKSSRRSLPVVIPMSPHPKNPTLVHKSDDDNVFSNEDETTDNTSLAGSLNVNSLIDLFEPGSPCISECLTTAEEEKTRHREVTSNLPLPAHMALIDRIANPADLFMFFAIVMQTHPLSCDTTTLEGNKIRRSGAVLVSGNHEFIGASWTDHSGHAIWKLVMKYSDLEQCQVYVTRPPCPVCTKLLAQSKVGRLFILPASAERRIEDVQVLRTIATRSTLIINLFIPSRPQCFQLLNSHASVSSDSLFVDTANFDFNSDVAKELSGFIFPEDLSCVEFDMYASLRFLARLNEGLPSSTHFHRSVIDEEALQTAEEGYYPKIDPNEVVVDHGGVIRFHFLLAYLLLHRTDDPATGVGCVITKKIAPPHLAKQAHKEEDKIEQLISIGWNEYIRGAKYHDYPRRATSHSQNDSKYNFIVHAEQNALTLYRGNKEDFIGSTVYTTKFPCHECAPLLYFAGVSNTYSLQFKARDESTEVNPPFLKYKPSCGFLLKSDMPVYVMEQKAASSSKKTERQSIIPSKKRKLSSEALLTMKAALLAGTSSRYFTPKP